ncbi:unnamed protein product [Clavelina lepadiformis]|uniref:Uncharacterized protein n=1 Tax=Clavelina lepadiformis TaxID=159417 RepID=A0ABP0GKW5_CLALP
MNKFIDFRKFPETIGNNQAIRNSKLLHRKELPPVYPFAKDASFPNEMSQKLRSNYMAQFMRKTDSRRHLRPTSPQRRHNPQSKKVFHFLQYYNKPVCHVKTKNRSRRSSKHDIIKCYSTLHPIPLTTCKSAFKQPAFLPHLNQRVQIFLEPAKHIVPVEIVQADDEGENETTILLPSCQEKGVDFMTSQAWKMNPRKRKFFPITTNHNWKTPQGQHIPTKDVMETTTKLTYKPLLPLRRRETPKFSRILDSSIFTQ